MTFLIQQTMIYAVPLMIVALAGVFAERSGIINLALEGIMILGAFIGVLFVNIMQTNHVTTRPRLPATGWLCRALSCWLCWWRPYSAPFSPCC